jgi:hypothetical protein
MFMSALHPAICYLHRDMTRLIEDLFNDKRYSRIIHPIYNQDKVMELSVDIFDFIPSFHQDKVKEVKVD